MRFEPLVRGRGQALAPLALSLLVSACAPGSSGTSPCFNGFQDPSELGVDCGGACGACPDTACDSDLACASRSCVAGVCAAPSCADGRQNQGELGVDCGGPCAPCAVTDPCANGVIDPGEGGVDCGGACAPCTTGGEASCADAIHNQDESDVDCGGEVCPLCTGGDSCRRDGDCASNNCVGGICGEPLPTCQNAERDPGESDVDCGGPCGPCASGLLCGDDDDCLSRTCLFGTCRDPSCSDQRQNQGESDVDCGGPACGPCELGKTCGDDGDCASATCIGGTCREPGASAGPCAVEGDCAAGYFCEYQWNQQIGSAAGWSPQCVQDKPGAQPGESCRGNNECATGMCANFRCAEACDSDSQCGAGNVCAIQHSWVGGETWLDKPYCLRFDQPAGECESQADCTGGKRCLIYVDEIPGRPVEGPLTRRGRCVAPLQGNEPEGSDCNNDLECATGLCFEGKCSRWCVDSTECTPVETRTGTMYRRCESQLVANHQEDLSDGVWRSICNEWSSNSGSFSGVIPCGPETEDPYDCSSLGFAQCTYEPILAGPDSPGYVEWYCSIFVGGGHLGPGERCSDTNDCRRGHCLDLGAGRGRECVDTCLDDSWCGGGKTCRPYVLLERKGQFADNTVTIDVCQ